jgi:hypothetical protein
MGAEIGVYAIDTPRLAELLERPVAELLALYVSNPRESWYSYLAFDPEAGVHISAYPDGRLFAGPEGQMRLLGPNELRTFPPLQQTGREWYSGRSLYEAAHLLEALSDCPGVTCVTQLISQNRWWIGGVLEAASTTWGPEDDRTSELTLLLRKILRDWDCGYPLPKGDVGVDQTGLPFAFGPQGDDPGFQYGRWTSEECRAAVALLGELQTSGITYECPPDGRHFGEGWHEWVAYIVDRLLLLKTLEYSQVDLVTVFR